MSPRAGWSSEEAEERKKDMGSRRCGVVFADVEAWSTPRPPGRGTRETGRGTGEIRLDGVADVAITRSDLNAQPTPHNVAARILA